MSSLSTDVLDRPLNYTKDDRMEGGVLAFVDSCQRRVAEWVEEELFTPELILERLTGEAELYQDHVFAGLRSTFHEVTTKSAKPGVDEASFIALLIEKIQLPASILENAGSILFQLLVYTSYIPFAAPNPTTYLELDALIRGIAILSPGLNPLSRGSASSEYISSRRRTKQDARRVIFQGIASPGPQSEDKATDKSTLENQDFYIDTSSEDARTTDLLDALVTSHPDQSPGMSGVARCFFRDVAKTLLDAYTPPADTLYSSWVSMEKLRALALLGLALQAKEDEVAVVVADLEKQADQVAGDILADSGAESVAWKKFDDGVEKNIPDLANLLGNLYRDTFGVREAA